MDSFTISVLIVLIVGGVAIFTACIASSLRDIARKKRARYFVEILGGDGGYVEVGERGIKAIPPDLITKLWYFNGEDLTVIKVVKPNV